MRPLTRGRLFCIFGCGGDRDRTKRPRMARAVAEYADRFVITSDNPRTEDPLAIIQDIRAGLQTGDVERCTIEPNRSSAIRIAVSQLAPGDTLVIAGKGHEDYQIIGTDRIHFDDVEQASMALREVTACVR
jgi:UDP-N-acetylmuramoyl-L-alanyl-D-glutamate--2,6-diaminopimelate ligase